MTAGQASSAGPMAASNAASAGSSGSSSATISANDFLTLLVTEMQNQDPTAQTDPNEYINQLVQVNSLEQLIDINQNLSTALGTSNSASGSSGSAGASSGAGAGAGATAGVNAATPAIHAPGKPVSTPPGSNTRSAITQIAESNGAQHAPGNLSLPAAEPAAQRVGHALDGHAPRTALPGRLLPGR